MITLYKDGNTHVVRGTECELKTFNVDQLQEALSDGWRTTPESEGLSEVGSEPTNDHIRLMAKEAGLENWESGRIKGLKKALGYDS